MALIELGEARRRRQARETLAKSLNAAAFLIHRDQETRFAEVMDRRGQGGELCGRRIIPGEEDDSADRGVPKHVPVFRVQFSPGQIEHDRAKGHGGGGPRVILAHAC
jgi:hypothetical protein